MTTDDSFRQLGSRLRDELRSVAGQPPPLELLRHRHRVRFVTAGLAAAAAVVVAVAVAVQVVPAVTGMAIDPVGPDGAEDASAGDDGAPNPGLELPRPVAVRVLSARFIRPSLAVVDLDRGETAIAPPSMRVLHGAIDGALILVDGKVVVWQDGIVRVFTEGADAATLVHTPEQLVNPSDVAPAVRVVPSADGRSLWVVQTGGCCPDEYAGRAELVDLETGRTDMAVELPANSFPVAGIQDGLVLNTMRFVDTGAGWISAPGSHKVLRLGHDGVVSDLAAGEVLAANADHAVLLGCEDHERHRGCDLDLVEVATGERRRVEAPVDGTWTTVAQPDVPGDFAPWSAAGPDGRILVGLNVGADPSGKPLQSHLAVIDPKDVSVALLRSFDGPLAPAAWDRRGKHVVLAEDRHLLVIDPANGSSFTIRDVIPADHYVVGIG